MVEAKVKAIILIEVKVLVLELVVVRVSAKMSIIGRYKPPETGSAPGADFKSKLLTTGQTISYHASDDGDLEKGVTKDFTVLDTPLHHTGTTPIIINGKTCNLSNNCVADNNTGLMWARYVPQTDIGPYTDGKLFWNQWLLENKTTISFDAASKEIRDSANSFDTFALCAGRKFTIIGSANNLSLIHI